MGNFSLIALRVLERHPPSTTRASYTQERHVFHVLRPDAASSLTFLVLTEAAASGQNLRLPFAFLEDIKGRFLSKHDAASIEVKLGRMNCFSVAPAQDPYCCN